MSKAWFKTWFNTKYYHVLYRNRNEGEARQFIDALLRFLKPQESYSFIDVACGMGRHSTYLNSLGYRVVGIDLSENSISNANLNAAGNDQLEFIQHDIREPFPVNEINIAVNLFTSFGYFDKDEQHQLAMDNMYACLAPGGVLVMDYFNTSEVIHNLKQEEHSSHDGIEFVVTREVDDKCIIKRIKVQDGDVHEEYEERVRAFSKIDLERLVTTSGFNVLSSFGDYALNEYNDHSPRVIIIAQKKE